MQKCIKKWLGFIIGSLILLCGCGGGGGGGGVIDLPTPTPYTINTPTSVPTNIPPTPTTVPEKFVGKVIDLVTKEPINEAEISIGNQTVYSDASGNFSIETRNGSEINISKNGYYTYHFNIGHENILPVKLVPTTVSRKMFEAITKNIWSVEAGTMRYKNPPVKYVFFTLTENGNTPEPNFINIPIEYINGEMKNIAGGFFASTSYEIVNKKPSEDSRIMIATGINGLYTPVMQNGYIAVSYNDIPNGKQGWEWNVEGKDGYFDGGGIVISLNILHESINRVFKHEKGHNDGFAHPNEFLSGTDLKKSLMNSGPTEKLANDYAGDDLVYYEWLYSRDKGNIGPDTNIVPKSVTKLNNLSYFGWLINLDTTKVIPDINTNII